MFQCTNIAVKPFLLVNQMCQRRPDTHLRLGLPSCKALTPATVLGLARADFARMLGQLQDIHHMWRFEALRKVHSGFRVCTSICLLRSPSGVYGVPTVCQARTPSAAVI